MKAVVQVLSQINGGLRWPGEIVEVDKLDARLKAYVPEEPEEGDTNGEKVPPKSGKRK